MASYTSFARAASAAVIVVGVAVLAGWMLDIAALKSVWPGMVTMKPNGALAFCLSGMSLWLCSAPEWSDDWRRRYLARVAALLVSLLGLLALSEYALGWDLSIHWMLFSDTQGAAISSLRISPITAFNLILVGAALLLIDVRTRGGLRPAEWLFLGVIAISLAVVFGYIYEVQALSQAGVATSLAIHTALTFILLCIAALCARHDQGVMHVLTSGSAGGALARRLLLAVLVVPIALGMLRLAGHKAGLYSDEFGDTLAAVVTSVVFVAVIWRSAHALDRSEAELRRANRALKTLSNSNQALVHAVSESDLLAAACRAIVESGGYRMAWVGYVADDAAKTVQSAAQAGFDDGYIDALRLTWDDSEYGRGPTGTAIRTGQAVVAKDILRDPTCLPWRALAAARGYASSIALPLLAGGQTLGTLNIYSAEPDAFDAAEARLLGELANDLSYGISALRTRAEHEQAQARLRAQADRLNIMADASRVFAEVSTDYQLLLEQVARIAAEQLGAGCIVRLLSDDAQWLDPVALYHPDPAIQEIGQTIYAHLRIPTDDPNPSAVVFRSGQPLLMPVIDLEALRMAMSPGQWLAIRHVRPHSAVSTPPRVQGRVIGMLALTRFGPADPAFTEDDLTLAQDLADRAALAISNARLFAQARQTNADLEQRVAGRTAEITRANADLQAEIAERARLEQLVRQDAARATALAELSQALAETNLAYQTLFETIARQISDQMGDSCVVTALSEDGQWLQTVALYHPNPEGLAFIRALMASEPYRANEGLAGRVVQTGRALLIPIVPQAQIRAQIKPEYLSYLDRFGMASLLIVPLRARGRILGTLGVSRDRPGQPYTPDDQAYLQDMADRAGMAIENARLFAEVQRAHAAAERASQAKTNFLRATSHELRTPLNAIIGFTGMLLMLLPGPLTADQESQLQTIQSSARHLLALINDLLDVSRIEAGKVELNFERVVCLELVAVVAASLGPLAEQKGLALEVLAPEQAIAITTDRRALSQILINLTNNAIKFTDTGKVVVSLRSECRGQTTEPGTAQLGPQSSALVTFEVRDTGRGIRQADLLRLFEPFARADHPTARASEGSGLGLHLSQQLAGLLGGRIRCESEYGVGSCFAFALEEHYSNPI
jgi:signal transduction histidine kinase